MCAPARFLFALAVALPILSLETVAAAAPHRWPAPAAKPGPDVMNAAKAVYSAGLKDVDAARWTDALSEFEKSYAMSGAGAALFNVATTLRAIGRYVEARDAFDQFLQNHPDFEAAKRDEAKSLRAEVQNRVAHLEIDDLPPGPDISVSIDGTRVGDAASRPLALDVDPGSHAVTCEAPNKKPFSWHGDLADGASANVHVAFVDLPAKEGKSVFVSPIFWTVVGVVVVGAASTWWIVKGRDERLDPDSSNVVHL